MLMFSYVLHPHQLWEQHWEDLQRRMQRDVTDHGLEITVKQRRNLELHEIELFLNKNGISLKDFHPMSLPSPDMVRGLVIGLLESKIDYD